MLTWEDLDETMHIIPFALLSVIEDARARTYIQCEMHVGNPAII